MTPDQEKAFLSILDNGYFLTHVAGTTKMARKYYNQHKYWCANISLKCVKGASKTIKLVLHKDGGCSTASHTTSNLNSIIKYGPTNEEEAIFYYYYKHRNFFIGVLNSLKQAFQSYTERREYCKNIRLPADFQWDGISSHKDRNFVVTAKDIMRLYGSTHFIHMNPMGETVVATRPTIKLPIPVSIDSTKCIAPVFNPAVGNFLFRNNC